MPIILLISGIRFGIRLKFFYLLHPIKALKEVKKGKGGYKALSLALAGTLGIGNIVGVAGAIISGGAGSIFWMLFSSLIAMSVKYTETYFALKSRHRVGLNYVGGAPQYIKEYFPIKRIGIILSILFAILCATNSLITGDLMQVNAVSGILPIGKMLFGAIFAFCVIAVIIRGADKISSITSIIIPILAVAYIFISLYIILSNVKELPYVIKTVMRDAFDIRSAISGVSAYSILSAIRYGVSRGVLSNEAGCGTSPIAHASSENSAHTQSCLGIFEVFIDTTVLCTLTATVILLSGINESDPMRLVSEAYGVFLGGAGRSFIALECLFFSFATVISQYYYGKKSLDFISKRKIIHTPYDFLFILICFISPFIPINAMLTISDINIGLMTILNLSLLNLFFNKIKM